ncbi:MAG: DsbA family protein [Caulobacteraceae bacterium]
MGSFARRFFLVLAVAGLMGACSQAGAAGAGKGADGEMSLGNAKAKVTIIEYASVTCPHCARFNEDVFPALKAKYIDTGKVRYVFREFLTPPQPVAAAGFLMARCAGSDKYFSVIDAIFHSQTEMFTQGGDIRGVLFRIGRSAGLTDDKINACIQDEKALKALNDRFEKAINVDKIDGTPTFVINGKKLESGEKTLAQLDAEIQPLRK